ncbi:MAG: hypothetical protein ABIP48_32275 [Planctomycetota bacterium]
MTYTQRMSNALAVLVIGAAPAAVTRGEDYEARQQHIKQAEEELSQIDNAPKPGDEVVALRDTQLKAGAETVGTVRKGEKLTVEQVQGNWLWVKSAQTPGWIDGGSVLNAKLLDWYQRLPDNQRVIAAGHSRGKYKGIFFEMNTQEGGPSFVDSTMTINGQNLVTHPVVVIGKDMTFVLDKQGTQWLLSVGFMRFNSVGFKNIPAAVNATRRYGTVQPGAFVRIDVDKQRVYVDGHLRGPRSR